MKARCDCYLNTNQQITEHGSLEPEWVLSSNRMVDCPDCNAKGCDMAEITIEDPITVEMATSITGLKAPRIRELCREYRDTNGESGLKSKKFGRDWQIERSAAEDYERTNRGPKPETN